MPNPTKTTGTLSTISPNVAYQARTTRFNPIRFLTPNFLARTLDEFDIGWIRTTALLFEVIEDRDDVLKIAASKRRKSVARRPWEILTTEDSPEADAHKEALEFFYNNITCTNAVDLNESGAFSHFIRQMMDAQFKRYAVHEIVWKPGAEGLSAEMRFVPLCFFENRTGKLRYLGPEMMGDGIPLEEGGWLITTGEGLMVAISIAYMFKRLSLQDWMNFSEKFGIPGIHGTINAAPDSVEFQQFADAVEQFANDWVSVSTEGAKIELVTVGGNGGEIPFAPMVERMDRRIAALCRGADLSTISSSGRGGSGSGRGASLQKDEEVILTEDDCLMISETLNAQVDKLVIQHTQGSAVPKAYVKIIPPQERDVVADIATDTFLLDSGAPIAISDALERYGRTMPEEGEPLLKMPPQIKQNNPLAKDAADNERAANQNAQVNDFLSASKKLLGISFAAAMQPLRKPLMTALNAANDEQFAAALANVKTALETSARGIIQDQQSADDWQKIFGASFVNGLARSHVDQTQKTTQSK